MKKLSLVMVLVAFCYQASFSQTAKEYIESGKIKIDSTDFEGAIKDFTLAIQLDSNDADAYSERAHAKWKKDENETASILQDCDKAIAINSALPMPYYYRAYSKNINEDFQGSREDYNQFLELSPNDSSLYRYRGNTKSFLGDYQGALEDYTLAIKFNPSADNYLRRAFCKEDMNDYQGALLDYTKAIELNPSDRNYYNRALCKKENQDYQGALLDCNKAIELNPSADNYSFRAFCKSKNKDYQGALADYTKAIELNSNDSILYTDRGTTKSFLGDYQGAIDDYTIAIKSNPSDGNYFCRALCKEDIKDYQGALADYTKAIEINPNADNYYFRGMCKEKIKDYQGALIDFNKAIEINPSDEYYFFNRAFIKQELNDFKGAFEDFNKSWESSSSFVGYSPQQKDTNSSYTTDSSYSTAYITVNELMHQKFIDATNKFFPAYTAIITNSYANPEEYIRREDNKVMEFGNDTTDKCVKENIITVLHESIHQKNYELSDEYTCGFYINDNQFSQVYFDDSFYPSGDLRLSIDSTELYSIQSNLVSNYLFSDNYANRGIYDLLDEFTAYAHSSTMSLS